LRPRFTDGDINGYIAELRHQAQAVSAGDLSRCEAMLMSQATTTLNALFHSLTGWALNHVKEGGNAAYFEMCMRLGMKAQSQSGATIETLGEIKNPRQVAFVKQANTAGGNQQINNRGAEFKDNHRILQNTLANAEESTVIDMIACLAPSSAIDAR
jgi:hypothetical protein